MPMEVRKTVTVLFCDVTGSTTLGERQDPEQVRRVLSRYFEVAREVLQRHGGTVEKFMGDAVMAVFGVPMLHEDDALRALRAAAELREGVAKLNDELEQVYGIRIAVRIGVNSGEVIAGDTLRGHSFAAGDAVNVAQRLEAAADAGEILVGEMTYGLARDAVRAEPVGALALKGRTEPVFAYRLVEVLPGALPHARRFDSPMVGRGRELDALAQAYERAVAERACLLFTVLGAAGVGKSRLVREALTPVAEDARVLVGTCLPYGEGITFWPVLEVVKQGTGIVGDDSPEEALAKIESTMAGEESAALAAERVAALVGLEGSGDTAEQGFWGFRKLLEALARERPTIVVFDDVNTGEPRFLDLVEHVAEWVRDVPLLLVCMARPELLDLRPTWGGGKRNATSIFLEPLSSEESRELLGNLLPAEVAAGVADKVQGSAEGNPLFVEEMVSMLIDGGYLGEDDGALDRLPVPPSIQVLLASRLDQLSSGERRVLERGAVEGTVFHSGAVEALADDDMRGRVEECLEALVRKELIRPQRASFAGGDGFRFRHVLIREAAYESVPKQLRAGLHERYAGWLEGVAGERLPELEEVLGYHLEQAYRYRLEVLRADQAAEALGFRASARLGSAGGRALAKGDGPGAVKLLQRAISLSGAIPELRIALELDLGIALGEIGELPQADEVLGSALEQARMLDDRRLELTALVGRAEIGLLSDPESAAEHADDVQAALPELAEIGEDRALALGWRIVGQAEGSWIGRFEFAESAYERALRHARAARDTREEATILREIAFASVWGPTPVAQAVERCEQMLAAGVGDPLIESGTLRALASLEARRCRFDEARALMERVSQAYDDMGSSELRRIAIPFAAGDIELMVEDYAAAERLVRPWLKGLERMGERGYRSSLVAMLAQAVYCQGRIDEAEELATEAEETAYANDIWTHSFARGTRARVLSARGEQQRAERLARETVALLDSSDSLDLRGSALLDLAEVLLATGNEQGYEQARQAGALFERKGNLAARARVERTLDGLATRR
jgi:class 3 adenylate cyclase/tetratricopeptide (TPR) repeat protein